MHNVILNPALFSVGMSRASRVSLRPQSGAATSAIRLFIRKFWLLFEFCRAIMAEDGAAGRLDALVLKLRHPLAKIRSRALQSLLFKLRERLVRWQELEPLHNSLVPALLASLEPPLELQALHVLQLLVQSQSELLLASLQRCGAAQTLQRAANSNAELRATYEKVKS